MGPCVSMEIGHIHSEGDAVKRLGHREKNRNSSARGQTARSIFCMRGHSISYSFMVSGLRYSCLS